MLRFALFVLLMLGAASPTLADNWADGLFDEVSFQFGTIPRGQRATHSFRIVNTTKTTVHIDSIRISSSVSQVRPLQTTLVPGEETVIIVQMDSKYFVNTKTQAIYVTFDKPSFAEVRLWVQANSREDLAFAPDGLDFKNIKPGATPTSQITVTFLGKPQILVTEATCARNFIEPKLQELRRDGGKVVYQVSATLSGDMPKGKWQSEVWLKTNDAAMPRVRVPVTIDLASPSK